MLQISLCPLQILETHEKNVAPVCIQAVHSTLMASHKYFLASDKHCMITHKVERAFVFMRNIA